MTKKILVIAVLAIFMFNSLGSAIYSVRAEPPISANGGSIDFSATKTVSNDYCNDYITISSTVYSPSNTNPTEVLAEFNGANITMKAPRYKLDGTMNGKNFIEGITYYIALRSPPLGINNLTIHVGNASGWYSTTQGSYTYNKTVALSGATINIYTYWITATKFLFIASTSVHLYSCIEKVYVTINGTNYDMIRDPELLVGQYRYEHDFGESTTYREWQCNATVVYQGGQTTSNNKTIELGVPADISNVWASIDSTEYQEQTRKVSLKLGYYDSKNRAPIDLILDINGVNQTLSKNSFNYRIFGQFFSSYQVGPMYIKDTGERLENAIFELNYSTNYNISIWYNNGTWNKKQIFINYNTGAKPSLVSSPNFTPIHKDFSYNGTHASINVTFNITSTVPNFQLDDNSQIIAEVIGPEISTFVLIDEADPSDISFADGKTYTVNSTIWMDKRPFWGNLLVNISLRYGNDSFSTNAPFNRLYPTIIIERNNGKASVYGFKGNEVLNYKNSIRVLKCCSAMYESSIYVGQYNLSAVVRYLNSDMIKISSAWLEKKYNSTEYGIYIQNEAVTYFNDDLDFQPYGSIIVVPLNYPAKLAEYINTLPVDGTKVVYKKDLLTGLMTISYKDTFGDFKFEQSITWDKRGILRNQIRKIYLGETLISETILELETTFMDLLFLDYLWYIIIGGGVVLIGIITAVIIKKRKG